MYKVYGDYLMHCSDDTLAHHGILGMKWGVRRYQNEDGTLTDAGRKRYADKINKNGFTEDTMQTLRKNKDYQNAVKRVAEAYAKKNVERGQKTWQELAEITKKYMPDILGEYGNDRNRNRILEALITDGFSYKAISEAEKNGFTSRTTMNTKNYFRYPGNMRTNVVYSNDPHYDPDEIRIRRKQEEYEKYGG